jgi:hypothetical protein
MLVTHELMHYIGWIIRLNIKTKKLSDIFQTYFLDFYAIFGTKGHLMSCSGDLEGSWLTGQYIFE